MVYRFNLINYDIYSKRIGFFFNNSEKIGSYFGLVLSVLYVSISFIIFLFLLIKTIQRKEIKVYDSTMLSQETPIISINENFLYFAFGLEMPNKSKRFIDETIYYVKIHFFESMKVDGQFKTIYKKEMDFDTCKEEKFGNYKNFDLKEELNNSYCLKDYNLTLAGGYKYDRMNYLRIKIYPCKNKTENNNHCKSPEIIDNYFKGGYFSILTKDIGLNPSNYSFPVLNTLQDLYTTIDKKILRQYIIYYGITDVQTDTGLLFENLETKRYLEYRKEIQNFYFREEEEFYNGKESCSIYIRLDDIIKVQKRSYMKLKEVFSSTGGYMQLISTIFILLSLLFNKFFRDLKIMNALFNFNLKEQKMMIKFNSIKDFNIINFHKKYDKYIYFPNNILYLKRKNKQNYMNTNNISKTSLIGIDNNNDNNSSIAKVFNKEVSLNQKKSIEQFNNMTENNVKISVFKDKTNRIEENICRTSGFFPKSHNSSDFVGYKIKNNFGNFKDRINFNIFHYYCFRNFGKKTEENNLFNSGIDLFKKRMDIINVFTFLFITENFLVENQEFKSYDKESEYIS